MITRASGVRVPAWPKPARYAAAVAAAPAVGALRGAKPVDPVELGVIVANLGGRSASG